MEGRESGSNSEPKQASVERVPTPDSASDHANREEPFKELEDGPDLPEAGHVSLESRTEPLPDALLPTHNATTPTPPPNPSPSLTPSNDCSSSCVSNATTAATSTTLDASSPNSLKLKGIPDMDGPPDDKEGFFGHPLTRAEIAINGEAQQDAQREALLHEYMNLEAWDEQGGRIRDCFGQVTVVVPSSTSSEGDGCGGVGGGGGGGGGGVSSSVGGTAVCSNPREVISRPLASKHKNAISAAPTKDYFMLMEEAERDMSKFDQLHHILDDGEAQNAGPEVTGPFPDPPVDLPSGQFVQTKTEGRKVSSCRHPQAQKLSQVKGVAKRLSQQEQGLTRRALRRSESEPCGGLTERLLCFGDQIAALADPNVEDPFSAESMVAQCENVATDAFVNADPSAEIVVGALGDVGTQVSSTSESGVNELDAASDGLTAAVVTATGILPHGHCVISSSSQPTLRISTANNVSEDASKPAGTRGKGRGTKGGQSRARGGQKEGARSKTNRRGNSTPTTPSIITSTSSAPSLLSSSSILLPSSPNVSSTTATPPASSPLVLSSLNPEVSAAGVTNNFLTPNTASSSSAPSPAASNTSVMLLPLSHNTLLTVEGDTPALVVPQAPSHPAISVANTADTADHVKQTTKDKLKLRIAQTAMTQPTEQQQQQQQHPQQRQQQMMNGHPESSQMTYQHHYQLQQQQLQHQCVQGQQHQQSSPPEQALAYLSEEELAAIEIGAKFEGVVQDIKQEDQLLDYDPQFPPPYTSEASLQVLYNSVPMATTSSALTCEGQSGLVSMAAVNGHEVQPVLTEAEIFSQMSSDSLLVQSQYLHLLQPLSMGQPPQTMQHQPQQQQQQHQQPQQPPQPQPPSSRYYNPNDNVYIYTTDSDNGDVSKVGDTILDMDAEKHHVLHYVQPQQHHQQPLQDHYGYGVNGYGQYLGVGSVDTSPDSGIGHDPGLSPNAAVMTSKETTGNDVTSTKEVKSLKRRKSTQNPILERQCSSGSDKVPSRHTSIQKLEINTTGYQYCMDTPISTTQRLEEDRVTYLNKSQYYPLILENTRPERVPKGVMCKTVITLVFREEKSAEEESKAWQFWHSRQHSYKQRILDIDTKNSQGVGPNSISELAFNAVSVKWNPRDGPVRVNIAVHCLSTDFSNQKGVKGIPLHIQCDTYELFDSRKELLPAHRGFCQIKVFCDKGAERKTRDEERRRSAKVSKVPETTNTSPGRKRSEERFHPPCEKSEFYSLADLSTAPVYFNPSYSNGGVLENDTTSVKEEVQSSQQSPSQSEEVLEEASAAKIPRLTSCASCNRHLAPLLYVKENHDKAYHAIHLEHPTVDELLKAIGHKLNKQLRNVTNFFKRSKNGMLVRMDDDIIRRYSHETAFQLEINHEGCDDMEVILLETNH